MPNIDDMWKGAGTFKIRVKRLMLKSGFAISFLVQIWDITRCVSAQIEWGGIGFVTFSPYIAQIISLIMSIIGYKMVNKMLPLTDRV